MTTKPTPPESSANPPAAQGKLGGLLNRIARIALIVCIGWAGWYVYSIYSSLIHGPAPVAQPTNPEQPPALSPAMLPLHLLSPLPGDGPWLFADQPWEMQVSYVPVAQVGSLLDAKATALPQSDKPLDWENTLIALARVMDRRPQPESGERRYYVEKPDMKATLFTRKEVNHERVLVGRLAAPEADGRWRLIEIRPVPGGKAAARGSPALLPMALDARRPAHRQDADGQVVAEIVSLDGPLSRVVDQWKDRGWAVEALTSPDTRLHGFTCRRDGQSIQVWASVPADAGPLFLLVVRTR
jgi:hypothetical protein